MIVEAVSIPTMPSHLAEILHQSYATYTPEEME